MTNSSTNQGWASAFRGALVRQLAAGQTRAEVQIPGWNAKVEVIITEVKRFAWTVEQRSAGEVTPITSGLAISLSAACDAVVGALERRLSDPPRSDQVKVDSN